MSYFDPTTWQVFTQQDGRSFLGSLDDPKGRNKRRKKGEAKRKGLLVLQKLVSPFDAYTYLHTRFGPPNGFQTVLARDDSDNLFHWDYLLKANGKTLTFVGGTKEVHVMFDCDLSDSDYVQFIECFKKDFVRVGKEKSEFSESLEKWNIFPNQYLSIANKCAELYDNIEIALPEINSFLFSEDFLHIDTKTKLAKKKDKISKLIANITTAPTELSVLMPVMFESFVGLLMAGLVKPQTKENPRMFNAFVRSPLDIKIMDLANKCNGFVRPIEQNNAAFSRYWTVVNKRNDIIHGNIDPVKHSLETVYFHGKRPLYKSGGDNIQDHWIGLIKQYKPQEVLDDYIAMHEFIIEILNHLKPEIRESLWVVMKDSQPGWDDKRKIFGRLFSDTVTMAYFDGLRYDWQLPTEQSR